MQTAVPLDVNEVFKPRVPKAAGEFLKGETQMETAMKEAEDRQSAAEAAAPDLGYRVGESPAETWGGRKVVALHGRPRSGRDCRPGRR